MLCGSLVVVVFAINTALLYSSYLTVFVLMTRMFRPKNMLLLLGLIIYFLLPDVMP